jgi:hypothetical protein
MYMASLVRSEECAVFGLNCMCAGRYTNSTQYLRFETCGANESTQYLMMKNAKTTSVDIDESM